jgi:type II secretory pathway pseudopilin PulG
MIEAIVIVAILAVLAGILTPMVVKEVAKSKLSRTGSDMDAIATAFTQYFTDTSKWPCNWVGSANVTQDFLGFDCMYDNTAKLSSWDGPYMERSVLKSGKQVVADKSGTTYIGVVDTWGMPYKIFYGKPGDKNAGPGGAISVVSGGPNGKVDSTAANALAGQTAGDDLIKVVTRRVY